MLGIVTLVQDVDDCLCDGVGNLCPKGFVVALCNPCYFLCFVGIWGVDDAHKVFQRKGNDWQEIANQSFKNLESLRELILSPGGKFTDINFLSECKKSAICLGNFFQSEENDNFE